MTQETALEILKQGYNVYLTGAAGSGKTYLLNNFIGYLKKEKINFAATAPTGLAATHLKGRTIHSWSGIGFKRKFDKIDWSRLKRNHKLRARIIKTQVLIIDEVSMLHADQLDLVDEICRFFLKNSEPFGGIQVVMCGDFFQLPPVSRGKENPISVMQSLAWQKMDLKVCYLDKIYRSNDTKLNEILNRIRERRIGNELYNFLDSLIGKNRNFVVGPTKLYTHNAAVDAMNLRELRKISKPSKIFYMFRKGNIKLIEMLEGSCQAPEKLILKVGAMVMFVKNNQELGYANGTIGEVVGFDRKSNLPIVKISNGKKIVASPETWSVEDEDGKVLALIGQVPLKLAWAITVHKSQGMTLDAVEMDLSKCFVYGMGYVALSRAKSLDCMKLIGLNFKAIEVDPLIHEADKLLKEWSRIVEKDFNSKPKLKKIKFTGAKLEDPNYEEIQQSLNKLKREKNKKGFFKRILR